MPNEKLPPPQGTKVIAKIRLSYLVTVAVAVALVLVGHRFAMQGISIFQGTQETVKAKVTGIVERVAKDDSIDEMTFMLTGGPRTVFQAQIRGGPRDGEVVPATQTFGSVYSPSKEVEPGDMVLLEASTLFESGWSFIAYPRLDRMLVIVILFGICVLVFGRAKGFNTLLSLSLTCAAVFAVFIPAIFSGKNIYVMAMLVCVYTTAATLLIVIGFNRKSLAAAAGCFCGIASTAIIILVMNKVLFLTGLVDETSWTIVNMIVRDGGALNLQAVVFAGIIIGAMGAVMDVAVSISSSLWEVKESAPGIKFDELLKSGMAIGRDVFGATANTLILAYIGTSLSVILILLGTTDSFATLLNRELVVVEIMQAVAGSLGILLTMPLTSIVCSTVYLKDRGRIRQLP